MANYMADSRLKLNDDKTHLLIMSTRQKQKYIQDTVKITTAMGNIEPIKSEKLLGVTIQDDLKWSEYLVKDKKSLVSQLSTRLSALKLISQTASFKSRLLIMVYSAANWFTRLAFGEVQQAIWLTTAVTKQSSKICNKAGQVYACRRATEGMWMAERETVGLSAQYCACAQNSTNRIAKISLQ